MSLRKAAQQALEALEQCGFDDTRRNYQFEGKACDDLRAALSEEAMQPVQISPLQFVEMVMGKESITGRPIVWAEWPTDVQRLTDLQQEMEPNIKPVAYLCKHTGWFRKAEDADASFRVDAMPLYTSPPERGLADVHQAEPVAWMVYTLDGQSVCVTDNPTDFTDQHRALPLYTSPPKPEWIGLTDEELKLLCDESYIMYGDYAAEFARVIETKLKEKNS